MTNYLHTKDVLNVSVSCFANKWASGNPKSINLLTWLNSEEYRDQIEKLRLTTDKAQRGKLKDVLPAITPSGTFTYRDAKFLVNHSRLIQFDIDLKDNIHIGNYAALKSEISKLPFVAYCGLSSSGNGYWGLVPIAYPERHGQHIDSLKRVFAHYRIKLDPSPRNVASLRYYSYDPNPYLPERVMLFDICDDPITKPKAKPRPVGLINNSVVPASDTDRKRVEGCIHEILRRKTYIGESYHNWRDIGFSLANAFGESGRAYFHQISQNFHSYDPDYSDKQFTGYLKSNSQATLGTFFYHFRQKSIEWKE